MDQKINVDLFLCFFDLQRRFSVSAEFFGIRLTLVVCGAFIALMGFLVGRKLTTKRVENTR